MTVLAAFAVAAGAATQAMTGFGFSLVTAPFLIAAYGAPRGVQLNLVLAVALNAVLVAFGRGDVAWRSAARLLAPAAVATVAVGAVVRGSSSPGLTVVAGLLCLTGVVAIAVGAKVERLHGRAATVVIGSASGAMNVVAGIGGPPIVLFGLNAGWSPQVSRATMPFFFLGLNAVALLTLGWPADIPTSIVVATVAGLVAGRVLVTKFAHRSFRPLVLTLAAAGSVLAVVQGLI